MPLRRVHGMDLAAEEHAGDLAGTPAETRAWREVLSLASDPAPLQVLGQQ